MAVQEYFLRPGGRLLPGRAGDEGADTYRVDPTVGLAHLPWDWVTPSAPSPADISPDDHRALTYITPPLDADLDITGHPEVIVHLDADQPDFPLAVWLSDVSPSGYATLICQGWVRPAHLVGGGLRQGTVHEIRAPLLPTSYTLPAGHRLRVAIAGADFPVLVGAPVNPLLTVHHGSRYPSRVRLPVVPSGRPSRPAGFGEPISEKADAVLLEEAAHTVSRDLVGRTATHRHQHRAAYRLEGGTVLRTETEADSTVDALSPANVSLRGIQTLTVERAVNAIVVQTSALETFDLLHIEADITIDGRPFYRRSWDLDLNRAAWRWKTASADLEGARP
jgi:hypothetical protein